MQTNQLNRMIPKLSESFEMFRKVSKIFFFVKTANVIFISVRFLEILKTAI